MGVKTCTAAWRGHSSTPSVYSTSACITAPVPCPNSGPASEEIKAASPHSRRDVPLSSEIRRSHQGIKRCEEHVQVEADARSWQPPYETEFGHVVLSGARPIRVPPPPTWKYRIRASPLSDRRSVAPHNFSNEDTFGKYVRKNVLTFSSASCAGSSPLPLSFRQKT